MSLNADTKQQQNTSGINLRAFLLIVTLLVVILLLLMAGDCHEDQNSALLTLALYLFM